jgi:DNA-binding Lrp family transcriptional regulator
MEKINGIAPERQHAQMEIDCELDSERANLLYAILKLQDRGESYQGRIKHYTGFSKAKVTRRIKDLEDAGYIKPSKLRGTNARRFYSIDIDKIITVRDTAVILIEFMEYEKHHRDRERKVKLNEFVEYLMKANKLIDFELVDVMGNSDIKGKIRELTDAHYIARISTTYIKLLPKAELHKPYINLVAQQPELEFLDKQA